MSALNYHEIGCRIRKQRSYLGYTREQLAEKLGVTSKFCSDIELGQKGMSLNTLSTIVSVLHLSADYILFGKETEEEPRELIRMLKNCPPEKLPYAEDLLRTFMIALR